MKSTMLGKQKSKKLDFCFLRGIRLSGDNGFPMGFATFGNMAYLNSGFILQEQFK
jgi:hypothetical protein